MDYGPRTLMNAPRKKPDSTTRVAALIVVAVMLVIATFLYNAIKGKRDYDAQNASSAQSGSAASMSAAAPAQGASQ
ncbi:MAG: hypothetical protein QOI13_3430 [Paraburkholderia sp.]|nr:hypothetical protein [Paraburkholderia sp.]MEA3120772.1 hypothetical protein [Paraburkholderia sp.]